MSKNLKFVIKVNQDPFLSYAEELFNEIDENDADIKPATSCSLRYGPKLPDFDPETNTNWLLEATVQVERSADNTYFSVVGFGPGGYSGIQQKPNNER